MKKFLLSALCVVTSLLASGANEADFSTMNSGKTDSGYNERTSTNGWKATNAAIVSIDNTTAPAINGNTTKKGVITSPTLKDGIKTLSFKYANTYSENNGVSVTINIKQNNSVVATETLTNSAVTKGTVYNFASKNFNVTGDFVIEITNNSPSNSTSNKDRVSIWALTWVSNSGTTPEPAEPVEAGNIKLNGEEIKGNPTTTAKPGDVLTFTSENAKSMGLSDGVSESQTATGSSISWTAPETEGEYSITINAIGDEGTTNKFSHINVIVAIPPVTGDVTFDFINNDYDMTRHTSGSNYNPDPITISSEEVSITFTGQNRLWSTKGMRFYVGATMTIISPDGYIIDRIEIPSAVKSKFTFDETASGVYNNETGIWTGEEKSVKLNSNITTSNFDLATVNVSYAAASPAIHIDGNLLEDDGIDLEGATKKIHFEVAEGVSVWYKFVEATPATPAEVVRREAAADTDEDGFTRYTGNADNGIELSKAGTLHYYTAVNAIKGSVKTLTVNNTTTSIREITAEGTAAGAIYDLQGRKVVAPAKGIFIVNGKKVRM